MRLTVNAIILLSRWPAKAPSMTIFDKVLRFIENPAPDDFEAIALEVFGYQFENVPAYHQYCLSRAIKPARVRSSGEIPPVSTIAFKYVQLESRAEAITPAARLFLTSGTTSGRDLRGRHLVLHPEIYRASAVRHLAAMLFPDGRRTAMLTLHPTADKMPESSLSQMISWCFEEFGAGPAWCAGGRSAVDTAGAIEFLRINRSVPVCILGTTAALAALFDSLRAKTIRLRLAEGSRVMDTGGAKGQTVPLTADEVIATAQALLGIEPAHVINEYGMTEMCSQLYDRTSFNSAIAGGDVRVKIAPPWLRVSALDPASLAPLREGKAGLLAFFDLANVGSVSALLTEDVGTVNGGKVRIFGRAAAAEPRGCALAIEQFQN
ncbi:MAG: hypothetical protein ACREQE_04045 [Candidatus Binataceae bacterium]